MLVRFTQVDYDREIALLALTSDPASPTGRKIVGVSRYIANYDGESAEFAVVVTDTWQGRGIGRMLMERLIGCAKRRGPAPPARSSSSMPRRRPRLIRSPQVARILVNPTEI
jgi:acetyltransferase